MHISYSNSGLIYATNADIPVPGDYDGDGKTDIPVYSAGTGFRYIIPFTDAPVYGVGWGGPGYLPVTQ